VQEKPSQQNFLQQPGMDAKNRGVFFKVSKEKLILRKIDPLRLE
jgi:hypothetical protein